MDQPCPPRSSPTERAQAELLILKKHHKHDVRENQCSSHVCQEIEAPVDLVWSLVRRFDQPGKYNPFVTDCDVQGGGEFKIGSIRQLNIQSPVAVTTSTERLEILDDEERVFSVRATAHSDHRMGNYISIVTVHPETINGRPGTLVVESYVVDVADGYTEKEIHEFVETLIKDNLNTLKIVSENLPAEDTSHGSTSKSKAIEEAVENKQKSIEKDNVPIEVESELESSNQEASSLSMYWMAPEVNITNGRCVELPENRSCPFLVKLFLQHNTYLTDIPASFFKDMRILQVLDMSNTSIKTLPSSISELTGLRELLLRGCEMLKELPPEIGCLVCLEVLDLEQTELVCLPRQVGWLRQLECLKFSLYRYADRYKDSINGIERSIIPRETLSRLISLKELSIDVDPECEWWDVEVEAIFSDLGKLGNLENLKLYLPTHDLFQQLLTHLWIKLLIWDIGRPLLYPSLSNFRFVVGRHEDPIMSCVPRDLQEEFLKLEKCLKYVNGEEYLDAKVIKHIGALFLHRHWNIFTLSRLNLRKMDNLKFCLLAECDQMRAILDSRNFKEIIDNNPILGSLCYLGIHYMKNLRDIWKGPAWKGSLSNLKILAIHTCPKLTTIFNLQLIDNLVFLQELIIEDCQQVQNLVKDYSRLKKELLPSLEKISLLHLPELKDISGGQWIAPRLEKMVIYNCPKLKNLHPLEMCSKDVKEIKGESKWWDSIKSGWSSEQHDYLVRVFVPLKGDDDDEDDLIDEIAEAVQISLTSQVTSADEHAAGNSKDEVDKHVAGKDKGKDVT